MRAAGSKVWRGAPRRLAGLLSSFASRSRLVCQEHCCRRSQIVHVRRICCDPRSTSLELSCLAGTRVVKTHVTQHAGPLGHCWVQACLAGHVQVIRPQPDIEMHCMYLSNNLWMLEMFAACSQLRAQRAGTRREFLVMLCPQHGGCCAGSAR